MSIQLAKLNPGGTAVAVLPEAIRVIGIDLGTTNSAVAEIALTPGQQEPLNVRSLEITQETESGPYTSPLVPSVVALYQGKEWVGEGAKRLFSRAPEIGLEVNKSIFIECKNDMGIRRTYHKAPAGYRSATDISARILRFLFAAVKEDNPDTISRTVITVPASFQANQRMETVNAANQAGINLESGDLMDEPMAAFIDFLVSHSSETAEVMNLPHTLLVFDFGGGTCDVAVLKVERTKSGQQIQVSPLAVSRYYRLGGGDIDRAILYEILIPQLIEQNQLSRHELTYEDKKNFIEPSLLGVAEAMKIGLCKEIARLKALGQYEERDKKQVVKIHPGLQRCKVGKRVLDLRSPSLTAQQLEEILQPFLDRELLYARETEYRLTGSIFAPIQDALDRCDLKAGDISLCLLVGGSSLIPQVKTAAKEFFENSRVLAIKDQNEAQLTVARGAAANALAKALYGKSVFQYVLQDKISIRTARGSYELIAKGVPLPFPQKDWWKQTLDLRVPETSITDTVPLLVEIVSGEEGDERTLMKATWDIKPPVSKGDRLRLDYRMDENQVLEFRLTLESQADAEPFAGRLENPLTNVVDPMAKKSRIQEMEENLRTGKVSKEEAVETVVDIAKAYSELGQTEKAIYYLKQALRMKNAPDPYILNLIGIWCGELGDYEAQEKYYRESARVGRDNAPLFNLALSQHQRRQYLTAKETIEECLGLGKDGPSLTLAAQIEEAIGNPGRCKELIERAMEEYSPVKYASEWELGWLITAARMREDSKREREAMLELRRRKKGVEDDGEAGFLPELVSTLKEG